MIDKISFPSSEFANVQSPISWRMNRWLGEYDLARCLGIPYGGKRARKT